MPPPLPEGSILVLVFEVRSSARIKSTNTEIPRSDSDGMTSKNSDEHLFLSSEFPKKWKLIRSYIEVVFPLRDCYRYASNADIGVTLVDVVMSLISLRDEDGNSVLHTAALSGCAGLLYYPLTLAGAQLLHSELWSGRNSVGRTPQDLIDSSVKKEVVRYFSRFDVDGGKIMEYNLDEGKTHLLVFGFSSLLSNVKAIEDRFDIEVEFSRISAFEKGIERRIQATLNHGAVSALIVVIDGNESPADTEALMKLICDKTLYGKPKVLWVVYINFLY